MEFLPLQEAWKVLGRDAGSLLASVAALPRQERAAALEALVDDGRKLARGLLVRHHPDRGGDPAEFRRVQLALDSVVHHTGEFRKKAEEASRKAEERAARRTVFIDVKKS